MSDFRDCIHKDCFAYDDNYDFNCKINTFTFKISHCKRYAETKYIKCGQKLSSEVTGEYPCIECGTPVLHDN